MILTSCYSNHTVDQKVVVRNSDNYKFEIQINVHNERLGNIHTLDLSKYEFESSHWIYVNSKRGKINSSNIILTYERNETEYPWPKSKLKGHIEFSNDSLLIKLKKPFYIDGNNEPEYWVDYEYNGKYLMEKSD